MSRRVHFEIEVGYDCLYQPACENAAGRDALADIDKPVEMTIYEHEVTCKRCLKALGLCHEPRRIEVCSALTETIGDPMRRAA